MASASLPRQQRCRILHRQVQVPPVVGHLSETESQVEVPRPLVDGIDLDRVDADRCRRNSRCCGGMDSSPTEPAASE
jgi:hypothetical protein